MKLLNEFRTENAEEVSLLAEQILKLVGRPCFLFFSGQVGVGKTTFINQLCRKLGISFSASPTYALHNRYEYGGVAIDHFDLYRLETYDEIEASGFADLLHQNADFKFIEWADRLSPADYTYLNQAYWIEIKKASESEARVYRVFELK